jgi:Zn-dependent protease
MEEPLIVRIVLSFILVIISLAFHEASHAATAYHLGDPTAKDLGRMSLNPLVHIDPLGTVIIPLFLALTGAGIFGWAKPVPVNPANLKRPRQDDALIAASGPAANLALALLSSLAIRLLTYLPVSGSGQNNGMIFILMILIQLIEINVILALFNLIPLAPLDGSGILLGILPVRLAYKFAQFNRYGFMILAILIFSGIVYRIYLGPMSSLVMLVFSAISGLPLT